MSRNLKSVSAFAEGTPFSESQLRWWIFQAGSNGLAKQQAIVRIGRRVYIDTDRFDAWIDSQQRVDQAIAA